MNLVRLLLEHGVDAAARDHVGATSLHLALQKESVDLVQLLHQGFGIDNPNRLVLTYPC